MTQNNKWLMTKDKLQIAQYYKLKKRKTTNDSRGQITPNDKWFKIINGQWFNMANGS